MKTVTRTDIKKDEPSYSNTRMNTLKPLHSCKAASVALLVLGLFQTTAFGEWKRDGKSLAWVSGTDVFWQFSFDPDKGKPFFHPLAPGGNTPLTNFRPADHPWHYALWFSWKYINHPNDARHVNYWEENSAGNAQGKTRWDPPTIEMQTDGRATIRLKLSYVDPSGEIDLTELRELLISAPAADGSFSINWLAHFTVGENESAQKHGRRPSWRPA